jgi:hypothetical protein
VSAFEIGDARAGATLPQLILKEKQIGAMSLIQMLKEAGQRQEASWRDVLKEILEREGPDAVKSVKSLEEAVKMLEDVLPVYDQLVQSMALPWKESDAQVVEVLKKAMAASPLARAVLPAADQIAAAHRRHQAQMALFKAALAVVQDGPDRLKEFKDPFGDGPFDYRAFEGGFELTSKLLYGNKPVMLTVGRGTKK